MIKYDQLWKLLKLRKISLYSLASKYHFSTSIIDRMKNGSNVTTDTVCRICGILDCGINDIMTKEMDDELLKIIQCIKEKEY